MYHRKRTMKSNCNYITGIQQVGIGVQNAREAMLMYKNLFGMNVLIFDDVAEASLMYQYTGGDIHQRRAILTVNMAGGGGFELWQFQSRQPLAPLSIQYGDLGIYAARMKCADVNAAHASFSKQGGIVVSAIKKDAKNNPLFWVKDKYENQFQVTTSTDWFQRKNKVTGGVTGAVIGVTDIDRSLDFYKHLLGINEVVYDEAGYFDDTTDDGPRKYRKVLLRKRAGTRGAFSKLLGAVEIELVQCLDRLPDKIFENRYWGDCGFIHLCMDVIDMDGLKQHALHHNFTFTVDSQNSFAMDAAAGRFCYLEDPDGTLIELVETHKVPVMKKYGLYLNLKKRGLQKQLPDWMIKMLSVSKVK
jgi:catechol 2,3-dioxygenase-like lactoylglutathione lyase family enzyme